jgi:hypothetical protein
MDGDFFEMLGGIAETFGLGEVVKGALRGPAAYASGRSTQTNADGSEGDVPYVYERRLTRVRDPGVNDR